ncbi:hypothetical protein Tco_0163568 [Tanacetum coccineum]
MNLVSLSSKKLKCKHFKAKINDNAYVVDLSNTMSISKDVQCVKYIYFETPDDVKVGNIEDEFSNERVHDET